MVVHVCIRKMYIFSHSGEKPSLHELLCYTYTTNRGIRKEVHIRDGIASEWKELGIMLKFESAELRTIEKSKFFQPKDCCLEILDQWLQGRTCDKKPITWETLLLALMEVGCTIPWLSKFGEHCLIQVRRRKTSFICKCLTLLVYRNVVAFVSYV